MQSGPQTSEMAKVEAIATLTAILGTLVVNTLSNLYPPQGQNVGEISNTLFQDVLIIPANYAFAIWGVIYVGLIAYGIYQLQPSQLRDSRIRQASRYLVAACITQILWIYAFTMGWFWLSVVLMLGILVALIVIYHKLNIGQGKATQRQRWLSHIPFSIYLAWISVATIVNVASALFISGLQTNPTTWTVIMLVVGGILASLMALLKQDIAFVLVFVWAYGAIALKHQANAAIVTGVLVLIGVWAICLGLGYWQRIRSS